MFFVSQRARMSAGRNSFWDRPGDGNGNTDSRSGVKLSWGAIGCGPWARCS
jgi:hypothetical protein